LSSTGYASLHAQKGTAKVHFLNFTTHDSVYLRWAPSTPLAWELANEHGYTLEKFIMMQDGQLLKPQVNQSLTIQPLALQKWEPIIIQNGDTNKYAAIAAQTIYGEEFTTPSTNAGIVSAIQQAKARESRYSYALFAADQNLQTAKAMGLFATFELKDNEKYAFKIYTNIPPKLLSTDTAYLYIDPERTNQVPPVQDLQAITEDQRVVISWIRTGYERTFSSFMIEKANQSDMIFRPAHENTFVPLNPKGESLNLQRNYFTDSLPIESGEKVCYRVSGINPFGMKGTASDTICVSSNPAFSYVPFIQSANVDKNNGVLLTWLKPRRKDSVVQYEIMHSSSPKNYTSLKIFSNPDSTMFYHHKPQSTNYYIIVATDVHGSRNYSYPKLVQLIDSIPPAVPKQPTAVIDSNGVVTLTWKKNQEQDLLGYRIYRSNFKSNEFGQITKEIHLKNRFYDSITLKSLTKKMYYKIQAVDTRFNNSELSRPLEVIKPDLIPPPKPAFSNYALSDSGVFIEWTPAVTSDSKEFHLYLSKENSKDWKRIKRFHSDRNEVFLYPADLPHEKLMFTLVAIDSSQNESEPAKPITIHAGIYKEATGIKKFTGYADREVESIVLKWEYAGIPQVGKTLKLYRTTDGNNMRLYKTFPASETKIFADRQVKQDRIYHYLLILETKKTKTLKIKY
jgi:hypothetical protein